MKHRPRKRFGQNFLQNQAVIDKILNALHLEHNDKLIEIGPGLGAITAPLLQQQLQALTVIEIDYDLEMALLEKFSSYPHFHLIRADALSLDYHSLGKELRVLGNLPYNIATPLILHLLSYTDSIVDMHFMLQKEVALRLAAEPGSKDYGRLSVMVQYHCKVEYLFDVPPQSFFPVPKVNSAFVRLTPYQHSPYPAVDLAELKKVVAMAFSMRRKTLANNVKPMMSAASLSALGIDPNLRAEALTILEYIHITNNIGR